MKDISNENKLFVSYAFQTMDNINDLESIINYANICLYCNNYKGESPVLPNKVSLKNVNLEYTKFSVPKKNGGIREIYSPIEELKIIQRCLNFIFQIFYTPKNCATGFIINRTILNNAAFHVGKKYVYNIDLNDFFSTIEYNKVYKALVSYPFNLNENLSEFITDLCCVSTELKIDNENGIVKNVTRKFLPQGAPTSPILSNIVCEKLDMNLDSLAKELNINYSRYADDITFSSDENIFESDAYFMSELKKNIIEEGFTINESKTRLQKVGYRQEVTGLVVNKKINIKRSYIKQFRMWLYYWEHYGYLKANEYFIKYFTKRYSYKKNQNFNLLNVLTGKLNFLKMVKGQDNPQYLSLKERFMNCVALEKVNRKVNQTINDIEPIIKITGAASTNIDKSLLKENISEESSEIDDLDIILPEGVTMSDKELGDHLANLFNCKE